MTRAQFITDVTFHLYADTLAGMTAGKYWYSNDYTVALNNGIITENESSADSLNAPITRQEMAMVMVRAALKQAKTLPDLVPESRIADYATIGAYYQSYVRQTFSMGLLSGYNDKGTFGPKDTLTEENDPRYAAASSPAGPITIYEGQTRTNRPARVGDTVIKADGTKVVLKLGPNGILDEGQGVAPDLGLVDSNSKPIQNGTRIWLRDDEFGKDMNSTP